MLLSIELQQGVNDNHLWRLAIDKKYSVKRAYESFLWDRPALNHIRGFGNLGHHQNAASSSGL
jgi:hypothetical protein